MRKISDIALATKLLQLRDSAKGRKIPFNISLAKLRRLMNQKSCYFTGIEFDSTADNQRTIDRVDTNAGYTDDNIVACTRRINSLKANLTSAEIKGLYRGLIKFEKKSK